MKFISDGTWFDKGTEAKLVDDCWWPCFIKIDGKMVETKSGLFEGIRTGHLFKCGLSDTVTEDIDQEVCSFEEFTIIED